MPDRRSHRVFLKNDKIYVYDKISKGVYIFDKATSSSVITKSLIPNGLFGAGVNFKRVQNNKIISYSDGLSMFYKNDEESSSPKTKFSQEISQVLKNKSDDDNPILFIFDLK